MNNAGQKVLNPEVKSPLSILTTHPVSFRPATNVPLAHQPLIVGCHRPGLQSRCLALANAVCDFVPFTAIVFMAILHVRTAHTAHFLCCLLLFVALFRDSFADSLVVDSALLTR